jgi:Zn-dependent protease
MRFIILAVTAMIFSGTVHEWAHAYTAWKLGDDTAARQGRLTLNPTSHIDPIGTLLFPAFGAYSGFLFGYMRPVPFQPSRFDRRISMRTGTMVVAIAGPLSNLLLAVVCTGLLRLMVSLNGGTFPMEGDLSHMVGALLFTGLWLNVVLFIFNLLPIYPLDGSKVLEWVLPRRHHRVLEIMQNNSLLFMILVFTVGARLIHGPITGLRRLLMALFSLTDLQLAPLFQYF